MSDDYAERWARRAKTPETRARIRRLVRLDNLFDAVVLAGVALCLLMILVSIVIGIWFWISEGSDILMSDHAGIFIWGFGTVFAVIILGAIPGGIVSSRLDRAKFADGDTAVGVINEVFEFEGTDGEGGAAMQYALVVTTTLPDGARLSRRIDWPAGDNRPRYLPLVGCRIRFRHNTTDPQDLSDAQFDGWPDGLPSEEL